MRNAIALLIASLVLAAPAGAEESWVPDWKMIAGDGSVLPSDCIGNTETLDCFIDTLAACSAWSEEPQWRRDGEFFEHPVCQRASGFAGLSILHSYGPAATQLYLYSADIWQLNYAKDWQLAQSDWDLARPGDTVADFFYVACSPNPGCLKAIDSKAPANDVLAACPRAACFGGPVITRQVDSRQPEDGAVLMVIPYITLLLRQGPKGWSVIDWYGSIKHGLGGVDWYPDHWKRK